MRKATLLILLNKKMSGKVLLIALVVSEAVAHLQSLGCVASKHDSTKGFLEYRGCQLEAKLGAIQ